MSATDRKWLIGLFVLDAAAAEIVGAVGYPGSVDGYQVNFRVPPGITSGVATVQLSAAWIAGAAVSITVR